MSNKITFEDPEPINNYHAGGSRRAADLARSMPAARPSQPSTSRARIAASKRKKARALPMGPTPERMAKGDTIRTAGGFHRSLPIIERLRDGGKLDPHARANEGMFQAAEKLRRHFEGCLIGVQAQDLNKVIAGGASDDLTHEEAWVHNFDVFRIACKLMGWSETNPNRGAGRIVVAVVCYEMTVYAAALVHIGAGRTEAIKAQGMDRLREGLFTLATHWRMA